jgi:8-oxo-dGTP diphosphatase
MKRYTCGFCFNEAMDRVVLIQKNRPAWQAGKLNGVGGHVEDGESPIDCMIREFQEEAGVTLEKWTHVLTLRFQYAEVEFFAIKSQSGFVYSVGMTDEGIWKGNPDLPENQSHMIENIPYLIGLSRQRLCDVDGEAPKAVEAVKGVGR